MSRTYRRKSLPPPKWVSHDLIGVDIDTGRFYVWVERDPNDKESKEEFARYYGDAGTHSCKEPGPAWFRNLYCERPFRRKMKEELRKYMLDEEDVVTSLAAPKLPYWT